MHFLLTWTERIPLVLYFLLVGLFCFVADHTQGIQLHGMQQPLSKRSYGHVSPKANSWLVYKITIKYFKFKFGGNEETAKKVVWGPPSLSLSLTPSLSLPGFSFPLNLTKWNQNSPLSWLFFWNKGSILPFNACRISIKVDRKLLHGMKKENALKSFLYPGIIFKGQTIRT